MLTNVKNHCEKNDWERYIIQISWNYEVYDVYDVYSTFAKGVLLDKFTFVVKEIAANILRYIAWNVNRFSAQHMVEDIINEGIDPMLEDIISSKF